MGDTMRTLPDGCDTCGLSAVACAACWHTAKEPCCELCSGHGARQQSS